MKPHPDLVAQYCALGAVETGPGRLSVPDKATYYRISRAGLFGNCVRVWDHPDDVPEGVRLKNNQLSIRMASPRGGGRFLFPTSYEKMRQTYEAWRQEPGIREEEMLVSEGFPNGNILFQGEVARSEVGYDLSYSFDPNITNREVMRKPLVARGAKAQELLNTHLSPLGLESIHEIWDLFPDSVIEFSRLRFPVGWRQDSTVIWEVRNY